MQKQDLKFYLSHNFKSTRQKLMSRETFLVFKQHYKLGLGQLHYMINYNSKALSHCLNIGSSFEP